MSSKNKDYVFQELLTDTEIKIRKHNPIKYTSGTIRINIITADIKSADPQFYN